MSRVKDFTQLVLVFTVGPDCSSGLGDENSSSWSVSISKQIRKNKYEKNLRIGVRFNGDKFVLLDGDPPRRSRKR